MIRGYVAKVLDSRTLAINKGAEHGVKTGMIFQVLDKKAESIVDPITHEPLGGIDRPKIEVKIIEVYDKVSLGQTFKSKRVNVGGTGLDLSGITNQFAAPKFVDKFETLKTDEHTWEDLPEEKSIVKAGDPVKQKPTLVEALIDIDSEKK